LAVVRAEFSRFLSTVFWQLRLAQIFGGQPRGLWPSQSSGLVVRQEFH
jgi:hypothetical protein